MRAIERARVDQMTLEQPRAANPGSVLVAMTGIGKSFSGIPVLENVTWTLRPGEVHILAGENGAGKTTLIKILAGVYTDYVGEIQLQGRRAALPPSP